MCAPPLPDFLPATFGWGQVVAPCSLPALSLTACVAGDIDLKLGCNVEEFISRTGAFVGDISDVA